MMHFPARSLTLCLLLMILSSAGGPVFAASSCKGLTQSGCNADSQCRWVEGYERKDGRKVRAHCRLGKRPAEPRAAVGGERIGATD